MTHRKLFLNKSKYQGMVVFSFRPVGKAMKMASIKSSELYRRISAFTKDVFFSDREEKRITSNQGSHNNYFVMRFLAKNILQRTLLADIIVLFEDKRKLILFVRHTVILELNFQKLKI